MCGRWCACGGGGGARAGRGRRRRRWPRRGWRPWLQQYLIFRCISFNAEDRANGDVAGKRTGFEAKALSNVLVGIPKMK